MGEELQEIICSELNTTTSMERSFAVVWGCFTHGVKLLQSCWMLLKL